MIKYSYNQNLLHEKGCIIRIIFINIVQIVKLNQQHLKEILYRI